MTRNLSHVPFASMFARGFRFDTPDNPATPNPAPTPAPLEKLREEFSRLQTEAEGVLNTATTAGRGLTKDEEAANATRFSRMQEIKGLIDARAKFASMAIADDQFAAANGATVTRPTGAPGREEFQQHQSNTVDASKIDRAEFSKALSAWALSGNPASLGKFATVTTATGSGVLLPKAIAMPALVTAGNVFREAMALYSMPAIVTGTTGDLTLPVFTATAGGLVAENASSETEREPTLTESINLKASTYQSGNGWFSNLQLQATDFDLVGYIQGDGFNAKELGLESAIVAAIIADAAITQSVTTATTTTLTHANLTSLNRALPKRYDRSKVIILSGTAFAAAELLTESGVPVLQPMAGMPGVLSFKGTPVLRSDFFEALTADNVVGCVVSLTGFRIRDAGQPSLQRTTDADKPDQTGFNYIGYHGYGYAKAAVAKLRTPGS